MIVFRFSFRFHKRNGLHIIVLIILNLDFLFRVEVEKYVGLGRRYNFPPLLIEYFSQSLNNYGLLLLR